MRRMEGDAFSDVHLWWELLEEVWKKSIFWEDFLPAHKLERGRELTKDRQYVRTYVGLCKFCQGLDISHVCNFYGILHLDFSDTHPIGQHVP